MEITKTHFPLRLKWLREKHGMSQKEVAKSINLSQQGYSKLELGQREPNLDTLFLLRMLFKESVDFIIGVVIEDVRAETLFELYYDLRSDREQAEVELQETTEYLELSNSPLNEKVGIIKEIKESIRQLKSKEDKAFDLFYNYVITIPGTKNEYATRDFWIEYFNTRKNEIERNTTRYNSDYEKL